MADDFDFRWAFDPLDPDASAIDIRSVIRRSRLRRLPAQLAVGGGAVVVVAGLVLGATVGLKALSSAGISGSSASIADAPAATINLCGGVLATPAPSSTGLTLTPHFSDAEAGATSVAGSVTMTNTSDRRWRGTTASSPIVTLSRDGIVLWHTSVLNDSARVIDLAPGASTTYDAWLAPVRCEVGDDAIGPEQTITLK